MHKTDEMYLIIRSVWSAGIIHKNLSQNIYNQKFPDGAIIRVNQRKH